MSRLQIAALLNFEYHTFARKLAEMGIVLPPGRLVLPPWQKKIFEAFWYPKEYPRHLYADIALP